MTAWLLNQLLVGSTWKIERIPSLTMKEETSFQKETLKFFSPMKFYTVNAELREL